MTRTGYILVNGNVAYHKGGKSCWLNGSDEQLEVLLKNGYKTLEQAKAALRRLQKDSGNGWIWGYMNPKCWEIKTITMIKEIKFY